MQTYTDPATGRQYAIDPATGQAYWLDQQPQPLRPQPRPSSGFGSPPTNDPPLATQQASGPQRGRKRTFPGWAWGIGGLVLGLAIGASLNGGDATTTTEAATAPSASAGSKVAKQTAKVSPSAAKAESQAPAGARFGTPVRDGKFEFTVTGVKTASKVGTDVFGKQAQGQFLLYSVTVKNIGDKAQLFDASSQKLYDTEDKEYSADSEAGIYLGDAGNAFLKQINPGNSVKGQIVFDVPKETKVAKLELHDSPFSGGVDLVPTK